VRDRTLLTLDVAKVRDRANRAAMRLFFLTTPADP